MGAKVSVIIPVYQVEKYIEECVKSVLAQTLKDVEIILVNDRGSDNSWEVAKNTVSKLNPDSNVVYLENEKNMGLAATRNHGLSKATGEYVYFLDSDDMITPDALEKLYEVSNSEGLDIQIFETSFIYENSELEEKFKNNPASFKQKYENVLTGRELYIEWMKVWDWMPSQPRFFYKRTFLMENELRFVEGMLHEDETFAFDVLMKANKVRVTNEKYFIRRFRAASIMTGIPKMASVEGCVLILDHVYGVKDKNSEDLELGKAIDYYAYKIFLDASRKYRRILESGADMNEKKKELTSRVIDNEGRREIFNLIESYGSSNK